MKTTKALSLLIAILVLHNFHLCAQNSQRDEKAIEDVFHLFFNSIKSYDTLTLNKITTANTGLFWNSMSPKMPEMTYKGGGGSTLKGFIKTIGTRNRFFGKCQYDFEDPEIDVFACAAILTVENKCIVDDTTANCGTYIIHFLKLPNNDNELNWKITKVDRIVYESEYCQM